MSSIVLDFERPILELERKINELKSLASDGSIDLEEEIKTLEVRLEKLKKEVFESLTPWQRVQIARHPKRPYTMDYINMIMMDFVEIHGDRMYSDDKAMVGGFAKIDGEKILALGHLKGRDTKENIMRSFGSAHPEGYRKAMRLMKLANKFDIPIVTFIDTPGAYPGIGAEERGQAKSIAYNLREMMLLGVPIIVIVIGEGGSGGALGIGVGDRVYVMENAYYSVISPEGCAAILWKDRLKAPEAAEVLKLTAKDLLKLELIDEEIPEPLGGAHRDPEKAAQAIKKVIKKALKELKALPKEELLKLRYEKFRKMGSTA
ncbi:MAG: acetyl-CoA carboxylase carboxyltransferase subunit alpha [Candidatus Omnitrophota bacterium]|nr:acetyl-CoA carboxylase carboxyltransferase subunit alpha [Candidatus Omnitrophota bacterium]